MTAAVGYAAENPPAAANSDPIYKRLRGIKISRDAIAIKNLVVERDIATFIFKEGTFYFLETVENQLTGAVFLGKGEFKMIPVLKVEQNHLKYLTGTPALSETFTRMVLRFTDRGETYEKIKTAAAGKGQLISSISRAQNYLQKNRVFLRRGRKYLRPNPAGSLLNYNLDLRILIDITWPGHKAFFYAFFNGKRYGDMLFVIDPLGAPFVAPEEVMMACFSRRNSGIWTAEHLKDFYREGSSTAVDNSLVDMTHYEIDAGLRKKHLAARVTANFIALVDGVRVIPFNLFPTLRMHQVTDEKGQPLRFIQEKEKEDANFAVILPEGMQKGKSCSLTFAYAGDKAVDDMGGGNYTLVVDARTNWYPGFSFRDRATYRLTLRIPKDLKVVATGWPAGQKIEGKTLISKWKSDIPLLAAGFNYGRFKTSAVKDRGSNITVESYANPDLPDVFKPLTMGRRAPVGTLNTLQLMDTVREEACVAVSLYNKLFGPMLFDRVAVTQQPYPHFGQAWPMLVYMPISSYFNNAQLRKLGWPVTNFFKYVCAHEIAHQWWAHSVGEKSYRSMWLSEALAQLSASIFIQYAYKNKKFIEFWEELRVSALTRNRMRKCPAKVGSITLGYRLDTGRTGIVGVPAIYAKGAFIAHMLRMLMRHPETGDKRFSAMLRDYIRTYYNKNASTDDFKHILEKHITKEMDLNRNGKMDWFFNQWVHGTRIPHYILKYRVKTAANGKFKLSYSITQKNVNPSFKMPVPVYVDYGGQITRLRSVILKGNVSTPTLTAQLTKKPKQVLLCAFKDILCTTGN